MTTALRFGANATVNRNSASFGSPSWQYITLCRDLTANLDYEEADATQRGSGGNKQSEPTLRGISLEFDVLEDLNDANYLALRSAFINKTEIDTLISTGGATTSGELTLRAGYKIFGFKKSEPLNGINTYSVSMKPCYSTNTPAFATN